MKKILFIVVLLFVGSVLEIEAQSLVNRLARKAENAAVRAVERNVGKQVEKAVDEAVDDAFEEAEKEREKEAQELEKLAKQAESDLQEAAENLEAAQNEEDQTLVPLAEYDFTIDYELTDDPFFCFREGMKLTYADLDKKGKPTAYSVNEITKVDGEPPFNCEIEYTITLLDDKKESLGIEPMVQSFSIKNGIVTFDENSFAGQAMQALDIKIGGTLFRLPSNAKVGDTFGDYSIVMDMGGIKTTSNVTNIRVVAEETVNVDGIDIECVVIEHTTSSKVFGIKTEGTQKIWYGRGYGTVRTETYDAKAKKVTTNALVEID